MSKQEVYNPKEKREESLPKDEDINVYLRKTFNGHINRATYQDLEKIVKNDNAVNQ